MEFLGDLGQVESYFGRFGRSVSVATRWFHGLRQSTIGSEIVLDAPDGTLGNEGQMETHFGLFGDSANLDT
jgi:hypothetical protein